MQDVVRPEMRQAAETFFRLADTGNLDAVSSTLGSLVGHAAELSVPVVVGLAAKLASAGHVDAAGAAFVAGIRAFAPATGRINRLALALEIPAVAGHPAVSTLSVVWSDEGKGMPTVLPVDEELFLEGFSKVDIRTWEGDVAEALDGMVSGRWPRGVVAQATASMELASKGFWHPMLGRRSGERWSDHFGALAAFADGSGLAAFRKETADAYLSRRWGRPDPSALHGPLESEEAFGRSLLSVDGGFPGERTRRMVDEFRTALMGISMTKYAPSISELLLLAEAGGYDGDRDFVYNDLDEHLRVVAKDGADGRSILYRSQNFAHVLRIEEGGLRAMLTTHRRWDGRPGDPEERPEDDDYPELLSRAAAGEVEFEETIMVFERQGETWMPTRVADFSGEKQGAWIDFAYGVESGLCALEEDARRAPRI